jgi:hypothetical protein
MPRNLRTNAKVATVREWQPELSKANKTKISAAGTGNRGVNEGSIVVCFMVMFG